VCNGLHKGEKLTYATDLMCLQNLVHKAESSGFRIGVYRGRVGVWATTKLPLYTTDYPLQTFETVEEAISWVDGHSRGLFYARMQNTAPKKESKV